MFVPSLPCGLPAELFFCSRLPFPGAAPFALLRTTSTGQTRGKNYAPSNKCMHCYIFSVWHFSLCVRRCEKAPLFRRISQICLNTQSSHRCSLRCCCCCCCCRYCCPFPDCTSFPPPNCTPNGGRGKVHHPHGEAAKERCYEILMKYARCVDDNVRSKKFQL